MLAEVFPSLVRIPGVENKIDIVRRIMSTQIAIDGPAGAGKSTIAKMVAKELGSWFQVYILRCLVDPPVNSSGSCRTVQNSETAS